MERGDPICTVLAEAASAAAARRLVAERAVLILDSLDREVVRLGERLAE